MKSPRSIIAISSDTPISPEAHLKLLCEILDVILEEEQLPQVASTSEDAA